MVVGDWDLGGFKPGWIISVDWSGYPTVILNCAARASESILARDEINKIFKVACKPGSIKRKPIINGECFQISSDCGRVKITDGMYQWIGVILYPQFKEDSFSGDVIEWQIPLELNDNKARENLWQVTGDTLVNEIHTDDVTFKQYDAPFYKTYSNITYFPYTNLAYYNGLSELYPNCGYDVGSIQLEEKRNIGKVLIKGSGNFIDLINPIQSAYLEVNGVRRYFTKWSGYHPLLDEYPEYFEDMPIGSEILEFPLTYLDKYVGISSGFYSNLSYPLNISIDDPVGSVIRHSKACNIEWIKVYYDTVNTGQEIPKKYYSPMCHTPLIYNTITNGTHYPNNATCCWQLSSDYGYFTKFNEAFEIEKIVVYAISDNPGPQIRIKTPTGFDEIKDVNYKHEYTLPDDTYEFTITFERVRERVNLGQVDVYFKE